MIVLDLLEKDTDDQLTLSIGHDGSACIEIDNPWTGDTMTGFGSSTSFTLTASQAFELADKLTEWARSAPPDQSAG